MTIHGVDVSAYQSETYSTAGLDFVFVKATEGLTYTNPRMTAQAKRARDAGLVVGFYHYPHMANDPIAEANYFLSRAPIQPGDIIVFDWEGYDTANKGVAKSRQVTYRDAWLKYVKSKLPGHRVGMYCNTDYWLNVDKTSNCGDFLWIATGGKPAGQPGINYAWTFHQYSTADNIDHDVANFPTRAALAAWARGLTPQEDDMPTADEIAQAVVTKLIAGGGVLENSDLDRFYDRLFKRDDVLAAPADAADYATNKFWTFQTHVQDQTNKARAALALATAQKATIDELVKTVAQLVAGIGDLDPAAIVTELKTAIESINIHLDVPDA